MLSTIRQLTARATIFQTRSLVSSNVLLNKVTTAAKENAGRIKELRATLKKEKAQLLKLRDQHVKLTKKHKELVSKRKSIDAEKTIIYKATRPYRNMSPLNVFIREKVTTQGLKLGEAGKAWSALSPEEKATYRTKADIANEEALKIWKPKPHQPPNNYASFVKKNWKDDGRTFLEVSKELSAEWSKLLQEAKDAYCPSQEEVEAYKKKLEAWKDDRVKVYKALKEKN